jgi:hypothetical protein
MCALPQRAHQITNVFASFFKKKSLLALGRVAFRSHRNKTFAAIFVLLAMPFIVHLPELCGWISCDPRIEFSGFFKQRPQHLLAGSCFVDGNVGQTLQALGHLSAETWLAGHLPWWNPYSGAGVPLSAEMQPASFFLPFILVMHFPGGVLWLKLAMQVLAGLCMFSCLRALRLSVAAALLGGLIYAFNGTFAWFGDAPILPIPFLPMLIAGVEVSRTRALAGRAGGVSIVAIALAFSLLAGFPETAFMDGLLAACWTLVILATLPAQARGNFALKIAAGGAIGVFLAAPAVIPFLDYLARAALDFRAGVASMHLMAAQEAVLLLPTIYGPPYRDEAISAWSGSGGYVGLGVALAGMAAIFSPGNRKGLHWLGLAWTVFWFAVCLGEPVTHAIWQTIPALNTVAVTRYAMPSIAFLWAMLAASAWDGWITGRLRLGWAPGVVFAAAAIAIGAAIFVARIDLSSGWAGLAFPCLTVVWSLILLLSLTLLMGGASTIRRRCLAASLLGVDVLVPFILPIATGMVSWQEDTAPVAFLTANAGFDRVYGLDDKLDPNYGAYFDIASIKLFSVPEPKNWFTYAAKIDPTLPGTIIYPNLQQVADRLVTARSAFEQAGVAYVILARNADRIAPHHDPHFVRVFESPSTRIYHLAGAAPYFEAASGHCNLSILSRTEIDADCREATTLLRRELFYPGWHATVNGRKVGVNEAAEVFQSVNLPAGRSRVNWYFIPNYSNLIACLFGAGLCGFVVMNARAAGAWRGGYKA